MDGEPHGPNLLKRTIVLQLDSINPPTSKPFCLNHLFDQHIIENLREAVGIDPGAKRYFTRGLYNLVLSNTRTMSEF
jgi:hypothetical protein